MRTKTPLSLFAAPLMLPLLSGCQFLIKEPPLDAPYPTVPKPTGIIFSPEDGVTRGTGLSKADDPALPDAFRVSPDAGVLAGNLLVLQSVKKVNGQTILGPPDTSNPVRLAGILTPRSGQIGFEEAKNTVIAWTKGQDLEVDIDTKYPTDVDGVRRVQVFFKGRPSTNPNKPNENEGKLFSLNRMMVRSGYAIVDLNSPTSFDQRLWLYDESYARMGKIVNGKETGVGSGLWPTGIFRVLQQRLPEAMVRNLTPKSSVTITPPAAAPAADPGAPAPAL